MKKIFRLFFILCVISCTFLLGGCAENSKNEDKTTNGFIENSWHNNVILAEGENLYLEYPIYITNPFEYNLGVSLKTNDDSINIESVKNVLTDENENFNKYQLSYNLQFTTNLDKQKKISNGIMNMNMNKESYSVDLGTSIVSILQKPDKSIEVEGGTLLIDRMETNEYEISYTLKNTTEDSITIKEIKLNEDDKFKIGKIKETPIEGKSSSTVKFTVTIDSSIKNTRVQPKIVYENQDGKTLETNLTTFIIADPIPEENIKGKHKIF